MSIKEKNRILRVGYSVLILVSLVLLSSLESKAQWTTPDASQNINSTNSNNVGVGTSTPNYKFDITNLLDKAQIRFGMGASDSGGFLYSGGFSHAALSGGASFNGNWIAKSLSASLFEANNGQLTFYANSGLTTGNSFTPTPRMLITSGGNVGIGTVLPTSKLHMVSGTDSGTTLLSLDTGIHGGTSMAVFGTANNESGFDMSVSRNGQYYSRFGVNSTGTVYLQPGGGNVGVGTATPNFPLEIYGNQNTLVRAALNNPSSGGSAQSALSFFEGTTEKVKLGVNGSGSTIYTGGANAFQIWNFQNAPIVIGTNSAERMRVDANGTVGIGTAAPNSAYKLDVAGSIRSSTGGFVFPDGSTQTTAAVSGGTITGVTAGSGLTGGGTSGALTLNVGAGTGVSVAADTISVNYGAAAGTAVQGNTSLVVSPGTGMSGGGTITLGSGGSVTLTNTDLGSAQHIFKSVKNAAGAVQFSAGSNNDSIQFAGAGGTTVSFDGGAKKITIDASSSTVSAANVTAGSFATGTYTFPGNVNVSGTLEGGNIKAKYQDLAEWVESSQTLAAGTVVVLDTANSNQVIASHGSYDSRVAGVISSQPGIALGVEGEGRVLVATTGRVKIKVDATNGPIRIGDLLVTSDKQGFAMKSIPVELGGVRMHRPGTLIGKALEPLASGTGEILVLLSLQ
jgi:hypothetical protein